jgi:hypothetical protein
LNSLEKEREIKYGELKYHSILLVMGILLFAVAGIVGIGPAFSVKMSAIKSPLMGLILIVFISGQFLFLYFRHRDVPYIKITVEGIAYHPLMRKEKLVVHVRWNEIRKIFRKKNSYIELELSDFETRQIPVSRLKKKDRDYLVRICEQYTQADTASEKNPVGKSEVS